MDVFWFFNPQLNVFCSKRQAKYFLDSLNVLKTQFLGRLKPSLCLIFAALTLVLTP